MNNVTVCGVLIGSIIKLKITEHYSKYTNNENTMIFIVNYEISVSFPISNLEYM